MYEVTREEENPQGPIRRAAMMALTFVRGRETETFRGVRPFVRDNVDRHTAIKALERIPTADWPAEEARPLLDSIIGYVRRLPTRSRTTPEAVDALQLADALTALLPLDQAKLIRSELGELGVRVIRLGTVVDQMLFDKDRLVVKAGRPVEIVFENPDLMPHNFVVTQPGALEEIGLLAESSATQPGVLERNYVPRSKKILLASRLLQPRESQKLGFTAPSNPGVYPYVCTYPGHWRRMLGALRRRGSGRVPGRSRRLPGQELAAGRGRAAQIQPSPQGVEARRPGVGRRAARAGRWFNNGKQMFQVANCVACHRLGGLGSEIGPDLAKLDPKLKPVEVLKEILDPSAKINEKYQTHVFETESGKVISGLVVEDTPERIKVIENPLAKAEPVVLKPSQVVDRAKSPNSIMPKGCSTS